MNANLAAIMPQVVAAWCEQEGHDVRHICYTGREDLLADLPSEVDLVFICAFSETALLAYALSSLLRSRGAVTAVGGPHARCYPQDAARYFDYVLGFTDRGVIRDVLRDCGPHRPSGLRWSAARQPQELPGVRERWRFVEPTLEKAPYLKVIPMLASLGCPYTCSFCIDSTVDYQPLDMQVLRDDLKFLRGKLKRPVVAWHDPNFGVRFDEVMDAIEQAGPPDSIDFLAESSLSLLSEPRLKRLRRNGFKALLPGVESWFALGNKSKTGAAVGMDKVRQVSEHVNMILGYIPYIQTNFVMGLDGDEGPDPFELTKRFVDASPGAFPGYSLLSAFGQAAPLNLSYQREGRVLPFPFHFLDNHSAMNVRPKNYPWPEFYERQTDLTRYTFSPRAIARRFRANRGAIPSVMNAIRAVSTEGFGRIRYFTEVGRRLSEDRPFRRYFEQETDALPEFFVEKARDDLGPFWAWLPEGALYHDSTAYLKECAAPRAPAPAAV